MGPTKADQRSDRQVALAMGVEVLKRMAALNARIDAAIARGHDALDLEAAYEEMRPLLWRTTRYLNPHSEVPSSIEAAPVRDGELATWRWLTTIGDRT